MPKHTSKPTNVPSASSTMSNATSKPTTTTEENLHDIPPHIIDVMHEFILGVHDSDLDPRQPHLRPSLIHLYPAIIFCYGLLVIVGVAANCIVLGHIVRHRLWRDPTYAFVANNAVADVCKLVVVLPPTLFVLLVQNWMLGEVLCSFLPMIQDIPIHVTTLTFLLMAWDRYRMVRNPAKLRLPSFVCASGSWLTALCLVLPYPIYILYVDLGKFFPMYEDIGLCIVNLTEDMQEYMRGMFLFLYVAPIATISYLYVKVSRELQPEGAHQGPVARPSPHHHSSLGYDMHMRERQRDRELKHLRQQSRAGSHQSNVTDTRSSRGECDIISLYSRSGSYRGDGPGPPLTHHRLSSTADNRSVLGPPARQLDAIDTCSITGSSGGGRATDAPAAGLGGVLEHIVVGGSVPRSGRQGGCAVEPHVARELRTQKYLVAMVTAYATCICPLMILRLARLALIETYDNTGHFDVVYTIFVWVAFVPTCSSPLLFAVWQMDRPAQERLRGYFRFSNRKPRQYSCDTVLTTASGNTGSQDISTCGVAGSPGPLLIPNTITEETQLTTMEYQKQQQVPTKAPDTASLASTVPISTSGSSQALLISGGKSPRASVIAMGGRASVGAGSIAGGNPTGYYQQQDYYYKGDSTARSSELPEYESNRSASTVLDVDGTYRGNRCAGQNRYSS